MILQPAERGLYVIPTPTRQTELTPMIIVGGLSAHRDHGVDGGRAADHLAAGIGQRAAVEARLALGLEHPVRARIADREEIPDRDVKPDPVVVAAGFQEQHTGVGIGRQPVGDDAARGARADHAEIGCQKLRHECSVSGRDLIGVFRPPEMFLQE